MTSSNHPNQEDRPTLQTGDRVEALVTHGGGYHDPGQSIYSGGREQLLQGTVIRENESFGTLVWDQLPGQTYFVDHQMLDGRDGFPVRQLRRLTDNTSQQ